MDEEMQKKLKSVEDLITRDIAEMAKYAGELDRVNYSLVVEHLIDLEYAVETLIKMISGPSKIEIVDTRSSRWE